MDVEEFSILLKVKWHQQILENLGIPHKVTDDKIIISGIDVQILNHLIFGANLNFDTSKSVLELLTESTGI